MLVHQELGGRHGPGGWRLTDEEEAMLVTKLFAVIDEFLLE